MRYDIAIIGGGLAGSALAALLARTGRRVVLFEKDQFPRDKLCGEFLSPESQDELRRLGALDAVLETGPTRIRRARFTTEGGSELRLRLPGDGLGVTRWALDALMFEHARSVSAETRAGTEVRSVEPGSQGMLRIQGLGPDREPFEVEAAWVVGAHGRRARLDHQLQRPFISQKHPYVGLKRHHRAADNAAGRALSAELSDHVEIHAFEGGYCGMSFVETGEVNVCMLLKQDSLRDAEHADWQTVRTHRLSRNRRLAERLDALVPVDDHVLAVAQIPFVDRFRFARGVLFVGDAAGMIAPMAGDGQAMALSSAGLLADLITASKRQPTASERAELGARWDQVWRTTFERRLVLALRLQTGLLNAKTANRLVGAISRVPGLAGLLARQTRG